MMWKTAVSLLSLLSLAKAQGTSTTVNLGGGIQTRSDVKSYADIALDLRDIKAANNNIATINQIYQQGRNSLPNPNGGIPFALANIGNVLHSNFPTPNYLFHQYGIAGRSPTLTDENKNYASRHIQNLLSSNTGIALVSDAILALDLWMYASHLLYSGALLCEEKTLAENPDLVNIGIELKGGGMDEFIALWIGTNQEAGTTNGYSLYAWAEKAAELFGTSEVEANVNSNIKLLYEEGSIALSLANACTAENPKTAWRVWNVVQQMVHQMTVPLIQTLTYMLIQENAPAVQIYAQALVPHLSQCRPSVHDRLTDLLLSDTGVEFGKTKEILAMLHDSLTCFGLSCRDIGALTGVPDSGCTSSPEDFPILAGFTTSSDVKAVSVRLCCVDMIYTNRFICFSSFCSARIAVSTRLGCTPIGNLDRFGCHPIRQNALQIR